MNKINGFDCDGVLTIGIYPGPEDIIITGRSFEEKPETDEFLQARGINNKIFYNPAKFDEKTRETAGEHKARTLNQLRENGTIVQTFFEDDEIQKAVIERECPWLNVVHIVHDLVNKENVRRDAKGNEI